MGAASEWVTGGPSGRSDADLVRACAEADRDEAFAELVGRHGRLVLAVCRGLLGDGPDAEDAFQATFLVLLRRVGEVKNPAAVGGWLSGVAVRVARRARQLRTRRREREKPVAMTDPNEPGGEVARAADPAVAAATADERAAVWEELAALPDKYRDVVLLCHLQARTTEDAAAALGCPVGTVRSRLLKARDLLRTRLVKRGLVAVAAVAWAVLADDRARAEPPAELLARTAAAARGGASPAVARLVGDAARSPAARWRWLGVSAGVAALLVTAAVKLSQPRAEVPAEGPGPPDAVGRVDRGGTLLAVSQVDAKVYLLDPRTGRVRAAVATDPCPHEVAVSPDGTRGATACYGLPFGPDFGGTVVLFDVRTGQKLHTVDVGRGSGPHGLAWLDDRRLLCTAERREAVVEIDADRGAVARPLRTAQDGTHMVVARGNRAFTANAITGSVTALDLVEGLKVRDRAVGRGVEGVALSPDGRRLWVANRATDTVTVLDAADLSVVRALRVRGAPLRLAFTPGGDAVAVALIDAGELAFFDSATLAERRRVKLAGPVAFDVPPGAVPGPAAVAFSPDGRTAYCSVFVSKAVAVIDVASGTATGKFDLPGEGIDGVAVSPVGD